MDSFGKSVVASILGSFIGLTMASIFMTIMSFFVIGAMVAISSGSEKKQDGIMDDSVFLLNIQGEFVEDLQPEDEWFEELFFGPGVQRYSVHNIRKALKAAAENPKIKSVLIRFRHFDGGLATAEALRRYLEEFRQSGKLLYAHANEYSQTEYYIASVADKVYLNPQSDFTMKGLVAIPAFFKRTLAYLGLKPEIFRVGKFKSAIEPFIHEKMSPEYRDQLGTILNDIWSEMRTEILRNRDWLKAEFDRVPNEVVVLTAEDAFKRGFVDGVRSIQQVYDELWPNIAEEDRHSVGVTKILAEKTNQDFFAAFSKPDDKIAVIFAEGDIGMGRSSEDRIGADTIAKRLRQAFEDEDVRAVVLRINSPGGSALASEIMWTQAQESKLKSKKPLIASFADVSASGGYYMAVGADQIFAERLSITGSIGVFGVMFNSQEMLEDNLRLNFDRVSTHPWGDFGSGLRAMTDFERKTIQGGVERVYDRFLEVVQLGRKYQSRDEVHQIAQGQVYVGKRAKELDLVDELGGLQAAIERAAEVAKISDYDVKIIRGTPTPAEKLREALGVGSRVVSADFSEKLGLAQKVKFFVENQGAMTWFPPIQFE